jgi:hypothetical protein
VPLPVQFAWRWRTKELTRHLSDGRLILDDVDQGVALAAYIERHRAAAQPNL